MGRILILNVVLNGTNFLLINFYNSNSEPDQVCTLSTLQELLDASGDNATLKKATSKTDLNKRNSLFM